jgi:phosphinothricin acetyltransferase
MIIRVAIPDDAAGITAIYAPIVAQTTISFELQPPDTAEMRRRIESTLAYAPWLVAEDAEGIGGYAYATRHRERAAYQWSVDTSVYVAERRRRTGLGRALYLALFAILRRQGFFAAHAGITLPNPASVALHESVGFRPIGIYPLVGYKFGAWRDVGWWQYSLCERRADPPPPIPFAALRDDPAWSTFLKTILPAE